MENDYVDYIVVDMGNGEWIIARSYRIGSTSYDRIATCRSYPEACDIANILNKHEGAK
jgi:hypothetical protein